MATTFDDATALQPVGDGAWDGEIQPGWDTPRGPLGGYVMAILMRGLELAVDDAQRTARSVTAHFLRAPSAGPVSVSATVERQGRSLFDRQRPPLTGRQADRARPRRLLGALGRPPARRDAHARHRAARPGAAAPTRPNGS